MARNPFPIVKGNNYLTRRAVKKDGPLRSADVLRVGNGLVVYRVVVGRQPTNEFKVCTEANFRRSHTDEYVEEMVGPRAAKKTIVKYNTEASAAW